MARIAISNGTWFNPAKARKFEEDTYWNGQNHISKATGTQWDHEVLYHTATGAWVLYSWSQWQGSSESYVQIDDREAVAWLVKNGEDPSEIEGLSEILEEQEARPRGRPTVAGSARGAALKFRVTPEEKAVVEAAAVAANQELSDYLRAKVLG